mmetsp:Transcript_11873/g.27839  ORF Transcript_11873/g.27839 Transcript_11873/m.27839 type:complete len:97 (-) Transcript_11873:92-382(-)
MAAAAAVWWMTSREFGWWARTARSTAKKKKAAKKAKVKAAPRGAKPGSPGGYRYPSRRRWASERSAHAGNEPICRLWTNLRGLPFQRTQTRELVLV